MTDFCRTMLFSALLTTTTLAASDATPTEPAVVSRAPIDAALRALVDEGQVAGASALIWEDGREAYFGAFGLADREAGRPMKRDTLVQVWSMTKPVTGVALMQWWERGAFDLDDPVAEYLPEFADLRVFEGLGKDGKPRLVPPPRAPTIRDLTRHTAGLASSWQSDPWLQARYQEADPLNVDNSLAEAVSRLASIPLDSPPGTRWLYSDAVDVQARLVEHFSGMPFADYVQQQVLAPLGMNETTWHVPGQAHDRVAITYLAAEGSDRLERDPDPPLVTRPHPLTPGGWGLASSLDDYMRFARMLLGEGELGGRRVLQAATVRLMATDQLPDTVTDRTWLPGKGQVGFGIDFAVRVAPPATPDENRGVVGEFFWDGAASTLFWVDPTNRLAAVFFIQRMPFWGEAHTRFRAAVYGEVSATPVQAQP